LRGDDRLPDQERPKNSGDAGEGVALRHLAQACADTE
jgi:hypothetical protein